MKNKKVKIFKFITFLTVFTAVTVPVAIIGLIILSIFMPELLFVTIPAILIMIGTYIAIIVRGEFTPIYLSDKGIEYRGRFIDWMDVKITVIPFSYSPFLSLYSRCPCVHYLVFDDKYLFGEDAKKQYKKGFCVYVKKKPLELILQYYQSKILVLDDSLEKEVLPHLTKKINEIINNFNKQFDK